MRAAGWLCFCWIGLSALTASTLYGEFRAGAATSNITPEIGEPIIGGFVPYPSDHIHDELHARCLVLDDGTTQLAIVVCDLLGLHRDISTTARELIEKQTGIPASNVLISATHTHSASSALGDRDAVTNRTLNPYQTFVAKRIADGVRRARNELRPAEMGFGKVEIPEHLFNRRWTMRPGTMPVNPFGTYDLVKMNPPAGSDNLVDPAGPTDPDVSFIAIREPNGPMISLYAAYSLHYVGGVGSRHVSADYYGVFCEQLKHLLEAEQQEPSFVALLANGTSGDINNINFRTPRKRQDAYEQIKYVAHDVAAKVHEALKDVTYQAEVELGAKYREPELGWRQLTEKEQQWARDTNAAGPKSDRDLSYIYSQRLLGMMSYPPTTTVPVQVLRMNDICIGTMPCEVFCEIGLEFKDRAPFAHPFMVSLGHGYFGYLPTPRHMDLGGYETWPGTNRLEREASTKMMKHLLEMANELKPVDAPKD